MTGSDGQGKHQQQGLICSFSFTSCLVSFQEGHNPERVIQQGQKESQTVLGGTHW